MAMYANVQWSKVSNTAQQPQWAVNQVVWDELGNVVFDENGQPLIAPLLVSPQAAFVPPPPRTVSSTIAGFPMRLFQGLISPTIAVNLPGLAMAIAQGQVAINLPGVITALIPGLAMAMGQGNIFPTIAANILGQGMSLQGPGSIGTSDVANIPGLQAGVSQGIILPKTLTAGAFLFTTPSISGNTVKFWLSTGASGGGVPTDGFFVSPTGNDSNSGTFAAPFLTPEKARSAMEVVGALKKTYIRGGVYNRTGNFTLTSADSGTTYQYYPPDGPNSAIFNAPGTTGTALIVILLNGCSNVTINGIQVQNFNGIGILVHGGNGVYGLGDVTCPQAVGNTIMNCIVHDGVNPAFSGGIAVGPDTPNTLISHNVVFNQTDRGITAGSGSSSGNPSNITIDGNHVHHVCTGVADSGAIYFTAAASQSQNIKITNNYVNDWAHLWSSTAMSSKGIYMDNQAANVTATGNVVGPGVSTDAFSGVTCALYNSAQNCTFANNVVDLGPSHVENAASFFVNIGAYNNCIFSNNLVIGGYTGAQAINDFGGVNEYVESAPGTGNSISNNMYFNYAGGSTPRSDGNRFGDTNPVVADPLLSGWEYNIASNSPALNAPISFVPLVGGWGPPGYTIPHTGTPPSCPHPP